MLCIVRRQGHGVSAYAAAYCFRLEVDGAVVVKYGLALAGDRDVIQPHHIHLLLRRVVESCRDSAFGLKDLRIRGTVVEEPDRVHLLLLLSHIQYSILLSHQMFKYKLSHQPQNLRSKIIRHFIL